MNIAQMIHDGAPQGQIDQQQLALKTALGGKVNSLEELVTKSQKCFQNFHTADSNQTKNGQILDGIRQNLAPYTYDYQIQFIVVS